MTKIKHTMTKRESREARAGWLFISPWLIGFLCLTGGPLLFSLYASFTNYNMTSRMDFIGLSNYIKMFTKDPVFWKSLGNTLYYVALAVPSSCICAIFLATLLNQNTAVSDAFLPAYRTFRCGGISALDAAAGASERTDQFRAAAGGDRRAFLALRSGLDETVSGYDAGMGAGNQHAVILIFHEFAFQGFV